MKQEDRLTKAYRNLDGNQLAALAFHYAAMENNLELERVTSVVPRKIYKCLDSEFESRLDGFMRFSLCWAIEHWRLRCRKAEMLGGALAAVRRGSKQQVDDMMDAHENAERCLLALDEALLEVCKVAGLRPEDVRFLADTSEFKPMHTNTKADMEVMTQMKTAFVEWFGFSCGAG